MLICNLLAEPPLDKVGGNYWERAWLSSQGHLFLCRAGWTKQQGFSSAYVLRTPPTLPSQCLSTSLPAHSALLRARTHMGHAFACTHAWMHACAHQNWLLQTCGVCLSSGIWFVLLIKGEHDFFPLSLSPFFSKVGHELLGTARNYQPCGKIQGGRDGEWKSRKAS